MISAALGKGCFSTLDAKCKEIKSCYFLVLVVVVVV